MDNKKVLKSICPNSLDGENIKSIEKQLLEFEYGTIDYYHPFVISETSNKVINFGGVSSNPLLINISTIQKLKTKHNLDLNYLINIDRTIENSIFAFDSIQHNLSKIFVTNNFIEDRPLIFILRENKQISVFLVNEITSIYDKKNLQSLIDRTIEQGGKTYINPEKIQEFREMGYDIGIDLDRYKTETEKIDFRNKEEEREVEI